MMAKTIKNLPETLLKFHQNNTLTKPPQTKIKRLLNNGKF